MAKVIFHIKGYGKVKIKFPRKYNKKSYRKGVIRAVVKTLNVAGVEKKLKFHSAMGFREHNG